MPTGGPGNDTFTAAPNGSEDFDGGDGSDTVSYAASTTGVYANLATGDSTPLLKIMPFGDSITYGVISTGTVINEESGGYRKLLWEDFQAADLALDFVGKFQNGPTTFDRDHLGLRGKRIEDLDSVDQGYLATYKPDAVLLMIGTNDSRTNSAAQMIDDLRALIISITNASPGTTVFVSTIPPTHDSARNVIVDQYNALIPALVDELDDTRLVEFVDMTDLTQADVSSPPADKNGLHPTAAGYEKVAAHWFEALANSAILAGQADTFASIENLIGSAFNDRLVGDSGANVLSGLAGADELIGNDGADTLDGGSGADRMVGGIGDDIYVVDSSTDVIVENVGEGIDTVRTSRNNYSLASQANVENLVYTGSSGAVLTGNDADNRIEGSAAPDTIDGKAGADTMVGGLGSDTYVVDNVADVIIEASGGGSDKVKADISYTLGANVESLTLTGSGAVDGTGNELANTITGNDSGNTLYGLVGSDTLIGLGGNDRLEGGSGGDVLRGGGGTDVLLGESGSDRFDWDSSADAGLGDARDQVVDFVKGQDRLDLAGIDARAGTGANDAFSFIGTAAFSGVEGQLRYQFVAGPDGPITLVQGDVNGDGVADFEVALLGQSTVLQASDFIL